MKKIIKMTACSRKAIWVTDKLHKKVKLLAAKNDTTSIAIVEEAIDLWVAQYQLGVDNSKKRL